MTFYTTIHVSKEPPPYDRVSNLEFHIDHMHNSDEMHFVFYNKRDEHDMDGWMMRREDAIAAARAILKAYGETL